MWVSVGFLLLAVAGCLYTLGAAIAFRRLLGDGAPAPETFPGVTILKPLHGVEPGLYDNLASFCDQVYPGPVQILFGLQDAEDNALAVVARLIDERPGQDLEVILHTATQGQNPKIANVVGLQRHIRHDLIIVADTDIAVAPNYLCETIAALGRPDVGAVTCLYRGVTRSGLWGRLSSMGIDYHFLPNVIVGLKVGLAQPCFGSTIALRRETLATIGGFDAFLNHIADDNAIGEAVRAAGMKVAISSVVLAHACSEQSAVELLRHEVRWARTVRAVNSAGYAGLVVTYPLPFALLSAVFSGFSILSMAAIVAAVACRLVLQLQVDRTLQVSPVRWWLGPVRDLLAFAVYVAGFFVDVVSWRGRLYKVRADGSLSLVTEPKG